MVSIGRVVVVVRPDSWYRLLGYYISTYLVFGLSVVFVTNYVMVTDK